MRTILNINNYWFFTKSLLDNYHNINTEGMESVNLPHTWNNFDGQDGGDDYYKGICTYQKELNLDISLSDKNIFIEFCAVNSICEVFLNGKFIGRHEGGYSAFRFEITNAVKWSEKNILAVRVDNTINQSVLPIRADFTFYGGIYRDVNIIAVDKTHYSLMDHGSTGIYVTPKIDKDVGSVDIEVKIENPGHNTAIYTILDGNGDEIASQTVQAATGKANLTVSNPYLWNGRKNPYLYTLVAQIKDNNEILDEIKIPFGFRYFNVDREKGFFLNGKKYALYGVSRHQDRENMGWAITKKEHKEDIELIKEIGASSIRLAHYQHDQYFYDLCDENGFVVWAEIPFLSLSENSESHPNGRSQMIELVKQNYNHPSICFWGLQNEVAIGGEGPELYENVRDINNLVKELDSTRLTTSANLFYVDNDSELNYISDIVSYNLYLGWYNGEIGDFDKWLDDFHKLNPQVPIGISEYGCDANIQFHSEKPERQDYSEEFQAYYHEKVWDIFSKKDYMWSTYVWNMFEFGSDARNEGGVKGRNNKGLVTFDRKVKKDSFYYYKAQWSEEKFVHITSKRFVDRVGETTNIKIYSNCEDVVLWVNGVRFGEKNSINGVFCFDNVPLSMGDNLIKAISSCGCIDEAKIIRVESPNESYIYKSKSQRGNRVIHWFEGNETQEEIFPKDCYSVRDKVGTILESPEAKSLVESYIPDIFNNPRLNTAKGMPLERILVWSGAKLSDDVFKEINKKLTMIKKK